MFKRKSERWSLFLGFFKNTKIPRLRDVIAVRREVA